jgi:hypothetical protein
VTADVVTIRRAEARFPLFGLEMTRSDVVAYLKGRAILHEVPGATA